MEINELAVSFRTADYFLGDGWTLMLSAASRLSREISLLTKIVQIYNYIPRLVFGLRKDKT